MKLPYWIRWLVHDQRCANWLRKAKRLGVGVSYFSREYRRSKYWRDHGVWPTDEQMAALLLDEMSDFFRNLSRVR